MTGVLGLSCFYHDSAAALVVGSDLVAAAQQERFSRVKHDCLFPIDAAGFCLEQRGLRLSELDAVVFYEDPEHKLFRILQTIGQNHPNRRSLLTRILPEWLHQPGLIRERLLNGLRRIDPDFDSAKLHYTQHHRSHAASAFFPSPFDAAAILTVDGVGEFATTTIHAGKGSELKLLRQIEFPHSIGLLYAAFTAYLGFKINDGEYKVMGLAPYGKPRFFEQIKHNLITLYDDGSFVINQDYFDFFTADRMYNNRLAALFGEPPRTAKEAPLTQFHMDLAASLQAVTTQVVLALARTTVQQTGQRDVCFAGGVALNCVANGHLLRSGIVDRLWIQPAAGDAGGAIGAAFIGALELVNRPALRRAFHASMRTLKRINRRVRNSDAMRGAYLGPAFSQDSIEAFLSSVDATFDVVKDDHALIATTVEHLTAGRVVGWYQGRMEFGPRALGNRSILADPRSPSMQRTLNAKIKNRESFRPFAPSITAEACRDWFSVDTPSPYMLLIGDVRHRHRLAVTAEADGLTQLDQHRTTIPAVTHVDYSARVQTVDRATNPLFHRLLTAFGAVTGVPILVNTSFNVSDEPIVCTPEDAYRCFLAAQIDVLVMGRCILQRDRQHVSLPTLLDIPATGTFEIENRWCVQWYSGGRMHALRNRLYQAVLSTANLNQPVPTTEYETAEGWWAALRMACQNRYVVITCGGSTTTLNTNWPFFLESELKGLGFLRPIVTINLGQPMYSSFDLFFLLERFLGEAAEHGVVADVVLSLDGANDIGYRIQTFIWALRYGNSDACCPNEVRLLDQLARRRTYPAVSGGTHHAILVTKSDKFAGLTRVPLPQELEDGIVDCFAATLGAFRRLCGSHGLRCLNFLQPLLLEELSSGRTKQLKEKFREEGEELRRISVAAGTPIGDETAFDIVRRRHNIRLHVGECPAIQDDPRTQGSFVFDWAPIYGKCARLWSELGEREGPTDFVDLSALFSKETDEVFLLDGVHYTLAGSRRIAAAIAGAVIASVGDDVGPGTAVATDASPELLATWARLREAGLDAAIAQVEGSARQKASPTLLRELQALLAAQGRHSQAAELGDVVPTARDRPQPNDVLEAMLTRCSSKNAQSRPATPNTGWRILDGQPPLNPDEAEAWASLAAELRAMAASVEYTAPSFDRESERGELYPLY
jgi:carbamoyltransferase